MTAVPILPFGAGAREHGPHMPMNADRVVMDLLLTFGNETIPRPEANFTLGYMQRLADKIAG